MMGNLDVVNWSFSSYRETNDSPQAIFGVTNVTAGDTSQVASMCCIIDDFGGVTPVQS